MDNGDGTWDYTPAADDDTSVSFTYTITDGTANVAGTASLDITPVNDAPTTAPVTLVAIAEDSGARTITQAELLANANDVDGDSLTATGLVINTGLGSLVDNGDGTWDYTPATGDDTSVSFTYTITDGTATMAGSASLDITPVNDAPTTAPVTLVAIAEDSGARTITQAELLANANDVDGDSLTATGLAINTGLGSLVDNGDGTWDYSPAADDDTSVTFRYTITDGTANDSGSAALDITPVNDAPTVVVTKLVDSVPEDADTTTSRKVGDITIVDDGLGSNTLTLTGDDSGWFEIVYGVTGHAELHLIAGAPLSFALTPHLDVTVQVVDVALTVPPASSAVSLEVSEVLAVPSPGNINADSDLSTNSDDDDREDSDLMVPHVPSVSTTATSENLPTSSTVSGNDGRVLTEESATTFDSSDEMVEGIGERSETLLASATYTVCLKSPGTMELEIDRWSGPSTTRFRIDTITREVLSLVPFHGLREVPLGIPSKLSSEQLIVGSTAVFTSTLSVGYVIWVLRSGSILASLLSTLPSWMAFDPLPILNSFEEEDDTGESLLHVVEGTQ